MDLLIRRRALMGGGKRDSLDTDGLIGYWDSNNVPVNNQWVDSINSWTLDLCGTASWTDNGYNLNNQNAPKEAWATFTASQNAALNNLVTNTFTCIVECLVKFTQAGKYANIIDFGSYGTAQSSISVLCLLSQNGDVKANPKIYGNDTSGFSEKHNPVGSGITHPLNTLIPVTIKCGSRILQSGKQEVYCEALNAKAYSISNNQTNINFRGCGGSTSWAFGLGTAYLLDDLEQWAHDFLSDIYYKKILLYNKAK